MRDMRKIILFTAIGCAIAAVLALCGCGSFKGFQVSGCSGSKCATATVQPVGGSSASHASAPAATASESVTPAPTVPLSSPTYDPQAAVITCLGTDPSRDDLAALAVYGSDAQQQLITCLTIPGDFQSVFMHDVARVASRALDDGRFDDHQGRVDFTDQVLPPVAVRCHSGQSS